MITKRRFESIGSWWSTLRACDHRFGQAMTGTANRASEAIVLRTGSPVAVVVILLSTVTLLIYMGCFRQTERPAAAFDIATTLEHA